MSRVLVTFSAVLPSEPLPRPPLASGRGGQQYYRNGARYQAYKGLLRVACESALPDDWAPYLGPLEIRAVVEFSEALRPKARAGETWHLKAPDWDNLAKPVQDALTGLVFPDDRTVTLSRFAKIWGPENRVTCQVIARPHGDQAPLSDRAYAFATTGIDLDLE